MMKENERNGKSAKLKAKCLKSPKRGDGLEKLYRQQEAFAQSFEASGLHPNSEEKIK